MQLLVLILVYLLSAIVNNHSLRKKGTFQTPTKSNWHSVNFKKVIIAILVGIIGVMILDQLSQGEPLLPALALIIIVVGEIYPAWKVARRNSGMFSYLGGILYLNPAIALFSLGLALEISWVGKDKLLAILVFIELVPILIWYSQMNPDFLWVSIATELLIIWGLKAELWNKLKSGK
jgi:hypothetical protein